MPWFVKNALLLLVLVALLIELPKVFLELWKFRLVVEDEWKGFELLRSLISPALLTALLLTIMELL